MWKWMAQRYKDNKEYRTQMARGKALQEDYRFVFLKIHDYMWSFASDDCTSMIEAQGAVLELFETSQEAGKHVLEVTGDDVASFCDALLRDTKKWSDRYAKRLNKAMQNQANIHS